SFLALRRAVWISVRPKCQYGCIGRIPGCHTPYRTSRVVGSRLLLTVTESALTLTRVGESSRNPPLINCKNICGSTYRNSSTRPWLKHAYANMKIHGTVIS